MVTIIHHHRTFLYHAGQDELGFPGGHDEGVGLAGWEFIPAMSRDGRAPSLPVFRQQRLALTSFS